MGILNITPDSFSDGGLFQNPEKALDHALKMQEEGADFIDLGAESTRPGSEPVSAEEEWKRLAPVLKKIVSRLKIPISIDTYKASVAEKALQEGGSLINDVSALGDPRMSAVAAAASVPIILMHNKREPMEEIVGFLKERIAQAVEAGIDRQKIWIDPGIGFGKQAEENLEILKRLSELKVLESPIVFGASRKSFIRKMLGDDPQQILLGSLATALLAAERGATVLRVHDVKETKALIHLANRPILP
jgi:dihydropteroate synthase